MNKNIIIWAMLIAFGQSITAQTYYYKYTKSIIKGNTDTNVSGGQFITFDGKKCYESDQSGNNVGNGVMAYDTEASKSTGLETYWGACYWSKNAYMKFNADKTLMNIETNAGKIYVYKRTAAPDGAKTCSLIRKSESQNGGGGSGGGYVQPTYPVQQPVYPQGGYAGGGTYNSSGNSGSTGSSSSRTEQKPVHQPQRKWCRVCGGTGRCKICNGNGVVYKLSSAGGNHFCVVCNNHDGRCRSCNGRGEWYE